MLGRSKVSATINYVLRLLEMVVVEMVLEIDFNYQIMIQKEGRKKLSETINISSGGEERGEG